MKLKKIQERMCMFPIAVIKLIHFQTNVFFFQTEKKQFIIWRSFESGVIKT